MIAVDTSALMAMLLHEPRGGDCQAALAAEERILISAGTMAEALIVSARRSLGGQMARIIHELALEIVPVTAAAAHRVGAAYERWGRGMNPAALNFGDCFAYEVAKEHGCRLLCIGGDFAKTDISRVLR
jgi:ribonuclease VapC